MSFDLLQKAMGVSYGSAYTRRSTTIPGMLLDPREIERLDDCSGHVMKRVAFAFGKQEENDDVQNDEIHLEWSLKRKNMPAHKAALKLKPT